MAVVHLKRRRVIRSRVVKPLVPSGELSAAQREFLVQAFTSLSARLCAQLDGPADDRTLADLFDAIGTVRDLAVAVLQEPEHVGLCRLELAKQLNDQ